jgi:hypothetical protein
VALVFSPEQLPEAQLGQRYSATITVSANKTPVGDATVTDGELPPGLALQVEKGGNSIEITGIPQQVGEFAFTIYVWCHGTMVPGQTGEKEYALSVKPVPTSTPLADLGPFRYAGDVPEGHFSLQTTPDGTLYAVSREMLYRLDDKTWTLVVSDPPASLLGIDAAGRVWAASSEMAAVWENGTWTQYDAEAGWAAEEESCDSDVSRSMLFASDGTTWITGCHDVRRFDRQSWQIYDLAAMGMTDGDDGWQKFSLAESQGNVWVAECTSVGPGPDGGGGVRRFDGQMWHGTGTPISAGCARAANGPDGSIWAVVDASLYQYDVTTDTWSGQPFPGPVGDFSVLGAVDTWSFDPDGDPWILLDICGGASCGGKVALYHYIRASQSFVQVGTDLFYPGALMAGISYLPFDAHGNGWLLLSGAYPDEDNGIYRLTGEQFELVAAASIISAIRTPDFRIWILATVDGQDGLWVLEP